MPKVKIGPKRHHRKNKPHEVIELDATEVKKESSVVAMVDLCDTEKGGMEVPVYKFKMLGHCHAQARPKPARNHNKVFDPSGLEKKKLAAAIAKVTPKGKGALFPVGPVELKVWFMMEQPVKNFVGRDPSSGKLKADMEELFIACIRPDIDNMLKFLMDAMNGIVCSDDCQVAKVTMYKIRNTKAEAATVVHVSEFVETHEEAIDDMLYDMEDDIDI